MTARDTSWYGRLDRDVIVEAALRIAARPGVSEVRFRELGEELGADPTAVYRHFPSKAALMEALVDRIMVEVTESLPRDAPWRDVLFTMAERALDLFLAYPSVGARLVDARPVGPGEAGLIEASLRIFEAAGLRGDALVDQYVAFSGMLLSYVAGACRERVTRPELEGEPEWVSFDPELAAAFPHIARYGEQLAARDYRDTYFTGVRVLIESIATAAASAASD